MSDGIEAPPVPGPPALISYDPTVDVPETDLLVVREEEGGASQQQDTQGARNDSPAPVVIRTYHSRWYILAVFSLLGLYQASSFL